MSDAQAEVLGMTLLHSLWQGALWSIILFAALRFLRHSESRYLAGLLAIGGFLSGVLITGGIQLSHAQTSNDLVLTASASRLIVLPTEATDNGYLPAFTSFLPWFINFWLLGTFLFIVRMIAGMHYMNRIENLGSAEIPEEWSEIIGRIASDLKIRRPVKVINSMHVDMPMVYGYFKPVLFLPVSYLSGLSPDQLEAVFAHELAHIRRHDFLVNFIQRFIEAIFFFNPFIWWISRSVNAERERCCDDLAVRYSSDRRSYVRALSTLEIYRSEHTALALGLASDRGDLMHRIRRLIEP
ncbi:MAG: M56 family metallopeptidase, partial [Cyclobacteriaceae bacterium]